MPMVEGYNLPEGLYYTADHAWVKVEGNQVRVGMNDFAQKLAGEITFVKLPKAGKEAMSGKLLSSMQSGKWAGRLQVPLNGKIIEVNKELLYQPQKINEDCYGSGWLALIEPSDLAGELGQLMNATQAAAWLKEEMARHAPKG